MELKQIATIHTDFREKFGVPRQSGLIEDLKGKIVFLPEYRHPDSVRGMEGFSHLWLLWEFSLSHKTGWAATVAPPRLGGKTKMGVFATRSPFRPNPIGLSCVKLEKVEIDPLDGPVIYVSGIDMVEGTPIFDIKPYLPYVDSHEDAVGGFGDQVYDHRLSVDFPEELEALIDEEDRIAVREILAQDPRTAFIHDEERVWGVTYKNYNVRFLVKKGVLTVVEVTIDEFCRT